MNLVFVDIFALICGIAGWFYLFYSKAAAKLSEIESGRRNSLRVTLRRMCGGAMFLMGICFFAGFNTVDADRTPKAFVAVWLGIMLLLLAIIMLVAADIHLTWKLKREVRDRGKHI